MVRCNVPGQGCENARALADHERCGICGLPVCRRCSSRREWIGWGPRRVCVRCVDPYDERRYEEPVPFRPLTPAQHRALFVLADADRPLPLGRGTRRDRVDSRAARGLVRAGLAAIEASGPGRGATTQARLTPPGQALVEVIATLVEDGGGQAGGGA